MSTAFILWILFVIGLALMAIGIICLLVSLIIWIARPKRAPYYAGAPYDPNLVQPYNRQPYGQPGPGTPYDPRYGAGQSQQAYPAPQGQQNHSAPYTETGYSAPYNPPAEVPRDDERRPQA